MLSQEQGLPLVSVITTAYNRGDYIRENIESVLNQNYPNIEHIVVDGGSTDQTIEILREYSSRLGERFRFVSERDRGQSDAVNKGLRMAKGEIIGWLNSDDAYLPGAIEKAVQAFQQHPEWGMLHGKAYFMNEKSERQSPVEYVKPVDFNTLFNGCFVSHPTVFIRKPVFEQLDGVDETLRFCMDYDLWIRISKHHTIGFLGDFLASYRVHSGCMTLTDWKEVGIPEIVKTVAKHYGAIANSWMSMFLQQYRNMGPYWIMKYFQSNSIFGISPTVSEMNRYEDLWAPPHFRLRIVAQSDAPCEMLLVKGSLGGIQLVSSALPTQQLKFRIQAMVNGKLAGTYLANGTSFILEIPLDAQQTVNQVELLSSYYFTIPDQNTLSKLVSFCAHEVIPLSIKEAQIYLSTLKQYTDAHRSLENSKSN